jgi:hypothetical protein
MEQTGREICSVNDSVDKEIWSGSLNALHDFAKDAPAEEEVRNQVRMATWVIVTDLCSVMDGVAAGVLSDLSKENLKTAG